jgi:enterochelin esterase-like enzyme
MKFACQRLSSHTLWLVAVVAVLIFCSTALAQRPHTLTGEIRAHKSFHSRILNNDRDVLVYLPPDYETTKKKHYPVLYLHDGQNLFDGATSFIPGQEWRVDETPQRLIAAAKIEPLIIVGVYNTGKDRINEYNYFEAEGAEHNEGAWAARVERILTSLFPRKM